ncbi:hypothetical protein ACPBZO_14325, partial [Escherichia coli]|uniref:hypothetical protein n=1 Tax=Escherichia coli TaxID=562 RepID=UPI00311A589D
GCNPTSSKFIHTWLRFGEIMRGSLRVLPANAVTIQSFINGFYNEHPGSEINLIACRENSNALLIKI